MTGDYEPALRMRLSEVVHAGDAYGGIEGWIKTIHTEDQGCTLFVEHEGVVAGVLITPGWYEELLEYRQEVEDV